MMLRPISTINAMQRIRMFEKTLREYVRGFIVIGHDLGVSDVTEYDIIKQSMFCKSLGTTVVAVMSESKGKQGFMFYQVPSNTMVFLDE